MYKRILEVACIESRLRATLNSYSLFSLLDCLIYLLPLNIVTPYFVLWGGVNSVAPKFSTILMYWVCIKFYAILVHPLGDGASKWVEFAMWLCRFHIFVVLIGWFISGKPLIETYSISFLVTLVQSMSASFTLLNLS